MSDDPVFSDLGLTPADEADPYRVVDLVAEGERLLASARSRDTGRAVHAVLRQPGQMIIVIGLPEGGVLPDHHSPGPASLFCLSGRVVLSAEGSSWTLPAGGAHVIPPLRHEVRAEEDSVCLLMISLLPR